jgi:hypothetical protein
MSYPPMTDTAAAAPPTALVAYQSALSSIAKNTTLLATHVSLYAALFASWQDCGYTCPFNVNRRQLMTFAKIASIATYHKCIKELDSLGYIKYLPSYHPKKGSLIYWPDIKE